MAKKQLIDYTKHQQELFKRIEGYAADVRAIYQDYFEQVIKLVKGTELVDGKPFSFSDYGYSQKVTPIFRKMYSRIYQTIRGGIQNEWLKSNENNDELVKAVFGKNSIEDNHFARFFVRNMEAMDSFFKRKSEYGGLNLSQRVWNYTGQYKEELENALDLAMGEGTPANRVSARVKQYLNDPDRFYRRFRVKTGDDDNGNPIYGRKWKRRIWDKASESYKWIDAEPKHYTPGKGIYRSSARNAQRLTRTETNMAYRTADQDRWQHMDFILGYRVKLSNNHPVTDICNDLSAANDDNESQRGVYPKDFVFKGWHPQCRCFVVPILAKEDEFVAMQKALLNGKEPLQPSGVITEPNENFKEWVKNNRGRIEKAKTLPYWVKDNKKAVEMAMASAVDDTDEALKAVAKAIGVEVGIPMTFADADHMKPNPNYDLGGMYTTNCQSTAVAYELRRQGLDVDAFGNSETEWYMPFELGKHPEAAWLTKDGSIPIPEIVKGKINAAVLGESMKEEGRYHLWFNWKGLDKGHIITAERLADGSICYYDAQSGKSASDFLFDFARIDITKGMRILKMNDLRPNESLINGIVKAANSKAKAPRMSMEQISWWLENVQGGTSFMGEIEPYSDEIVKQLKKCKTKTQRNNLLESVAHGKDAKVLNDNGKAFTTCYPGHRSMKGETWENTKQIAIDLNDGGVSVCFLSERKDETSADAIINIAGSWRLADFKCSQSVKSNTIATDIEHAFEQADSCVIKVLKADKGIICDTLSYFERNKIKTGNLIFVNKYGKYLIVKPSDVANGKFRYSLKGFF